MGAALETVTVQHERAKTPRQVRISRNVKRAIDAMVFQGAKRAEAAIIGGITDKALYSALTLPHVLAYLNAQQQVLRTSASARSIARIDTLADDSDSDHVKMDANKFLLGIEGISPIAKSENININKGMTPGLTINLMVGHAPIGDAHLIDGQVHQVEMRQPINGLPSPVPHPSKGNARQTAQETEGLPANRGGRDPAPPGEKP